MTPIRLTEIRIDGGTQPRAEINDTVVADYADAIRDGVTLPPVTLFYDGASYWLADGFHRFHAHARVGAVEIASNVHQGDKRAAILFSVGANASHGLRRTNADKRNAVATLLRDDEWSAWSDREIARACAVGAPLVADVRRSICNPITDRAAARTVQRGGSVYQMETDGIGRKADKSTAAPIATVTNNPEHTIPAVPAPVAARQVAAQKPKQQPRIETNDHVVSVRSQCSGHEDDSSDDDHSLSLDELVDELQRENEQLRGELEAATADDASAEALKWRRMYDNAVRQQSEAMEASAREQRRADMLNRKLRQCCEILGLDDDRSLIPELRKLAGSAGAP